ncbi:MAG: response regulator transcription factor [Chloroflexota bacterium]
MKPRILIVDDDRSLGQLLSQYLREKGFHVFVAGNGNDGLRMAYSERPDMVLLDVMLPGMDGWEVCARLRQMTETPIIMLTAKTDESDKLRGFDLGVDDYVTKPFGFAELVARIQAVLGRSKVPASDQAKILSFSSFVLDLDRFKAEIAGQPLNLTPTEFRILEVLVRARGRVVSDEYLIREVWGGASDDRALVRRYMLLLRKKIEQDPAKPVLIRTMRGFGYFLGSDTGPGQKLDG